MELKDRLRVLREEKGISKEDLAFRLNVMTRDVEDWESGYKKPDIDICVELAKLYNISLEQLTGKYEERVYSNNDESTVHNVRGKFALAERWKLSKLGQRGLSLSVLSLPTIFFSIVTSLLLYFVVRPQVVSSTNNIASYSNKPSWYCEAFPDECASKVEFLSNAIDIPILIIGIVGCIALTIFIVGIVLIVVDKFKQAK